MGKRKSAMKNRPLAPGLALIGGLIAALAAPAAAQGQAPAASPFPPPPPPGQTGVFEAPSSGAQGSPFPPASQQSVFPQGGASPFGAPAQPQMPPQCQSFVKIRDDARAKADKVGQISKKHGDRKDMCAAVTRFAEAEAKVVKFLEENKTACGIPNEAVKGAQQGHANTMKFRETVCAEGPKPKIPTLSDAINTVPVDTPKNTRTGPGTFDTLTGNPLQR